MNITNKKSKKLTESSKKGFLDKIAFWAFIVGETLTNMPYHDPDYKPPSLLPLSVQWNPFDVLMDEIIERFKF